jgi:hypothetical protein
MKIKAYFTLLLYLKLKILNSFIIYKELILILRVLNNLNSLIVLYKYKLNYI